MTATYSRKKQYPTLTKKQKEKKEKKESPPK